MWHVGTGQRRIAVTGVMAGLLFAAQPLMATPPGFDLDLKELKKPAAPLPVIRKAAPPKQEKVAAKPAPEQAGSKKLKTAAPKTAAKKAEPVAKQTATAAPVPPQSSYTVAAGETLYGILTRRYGLSADAANRLLPVVVHHNKLSDAANLTAGQKLTIPLAMPTTVPSTVAPPVALAVAAGKATEPTERVVLLDARTACPLARQMLEAVAQPVDPNELLQGSALPAVAAARFEGIIAVLACGLPRAEEYTYRRLLEMQGTQLIALSGDDPLPQAVQSVADALGISYLRQTTPADSYLVRKSGTTDQMLRLMISSSPSGHGSAFR